MYQPFHIFLISPIFLFLIHDRNSSPHILFFVFEPAENLRLALITITVEVEVAIETVFDVVDDDTTATVGVVETVVIGATLVVACVTIDPSSTVSFDFFGHPFAKIHLRCYSLGFFSRRASPPENSHPCSSSAHDHSGIRKT